MSILFNEEAKLKLLKGISTIGDAVGSTMGPGGRTVIIDSPNHTRGLTVTKDGVSVAKHVYSDDPVENLAIRILREASENTADNVGDGTSQTIVLARALVENGLPYCTGNQTVKINRAIRKYSELIIAELQKRSKKVSFKNLASVATISANGDSSIGKIIADTYKAIGVNGAVTIENSPTAETYAEVAEGVKFNRGYYNQLFVNNQATNECHLKDCLILLTDIEIPTLSQIEELLKHASSLKKQLLIIAPVAGAVIAVLAANFRNGYKFVPVEPPSFGYKQTDLMQDLALVTGATFFSKNSGDNLELIQPEHLGFAESVKISKDQTVIELAKLSNGDWVQEKIAEISNKLNQKVKKKEKDFLRERLAFLNGKVATIFVGADSEVEQKEKLDRVDDAVCATRSALEEGILPGGGIALYNMHDLMYDFLPEQPDLSEDTALSILGAAMLAPFDTIMRNAEIEVPEEFEDEEKHFDIGIDATDGKIKNMYEAGIIDPFKVTKNALRNAVSVATTIMTTAVTITK